LKEVVPLVNRFYTPYSFLEIFLAPHVAVCLIMEDMQLTDPTAAYQVMLDSSEFGSLFHRVIDETADDIVRNIPYRSCI
jgi:hypothetical protein